MNDKKLMELVRLYPVIYDTANIKYMDVEFKNAIWNKIGEEMKTSGNLCKARWNNIRDNFRKSLKKNASRSGVKGKSVKMYKYSQQLSFMKKYFDLSESISNVDSEGINHDLSGDEDDEVDEPMISIIKMENVEQSEQDEQHIDENSQYSNVPIETNTTPTQTDDLPHATTSKRQKRQKSVPPISAAATVMEYILQRNESMNALSTQSLHPVDAFLNGIAPPLKNLSPLLLHHAKNEIFAIAQKYELKMLMDEKERAQCNEFSTPTYSREPSPSAGIHHFMNLSENFSNQRQPATDSSTSNILDQNTIKN